MRAAPLLLWSLGTAHVGDLKADDTPILVVTQPGIEAYAEAVRGFKTALRNSLTARVVEAADGAAVKAALEGSPHLAIALGSDALAALETARSEAPVLLAMVLHPAKRESTIHLAGSVQLDLTAAQLLDDIAALFPGKNRIGLINNPAAAPWMDAAALAHARQQGFLVHVAECASPEDLLRVFLSFRGEADFVIALPDSTLYNSATIKPLILASLENRLPLVGFSAAFVRSGAVLGVYPDFEDVGQQTAEAAQRILSGQTHFIHEGPRKHITAVNQRVLRLIGIDYSRRPDVVVFK